MMGHLRSFKPKSAELAPEGTTYGVCYSIIDLGTTISERYHKPQSNIEIGWELPDCLMDDGRPFAVFRKYSLSFYKAGKRISTLRKDLESWRGREFKEEELELGFDFSKLLGMNCLLSIVHNESEGKTYANIASIAAPIKPVIGKTPEGKPIYGKPIHMKASNPFRFFDLSAPDMNVFNSLSDFIQERIMESIEYKKMKGIVDEPPEEEDATDENEHDAWNGYPTNEEHSEGTDEATQDVDDLLDKIDKDLQGDREDK